VPGDCNDVCDGIFDFHNKSDAETCCNLTRGPTTMIRPRLPTEAPPSAAPSSPGAEN
jgi:hypothetical protein